MLINVPYLNNTAIGKLCGTVGILVVVLVELWNHRVGRHLEQIYSPCQVQGPPGVFLIPHMLSADLLPVMSSQNVWGRSVRRAGLRSQRICLNMPIVLI